MLQSCGNQSCETWFEEEINSLTGFYMMETLVLNPFHATGLFTLPENIRQNRGFLMFSGGIEKDQWHEMG